MAATIAEAVEAIEELRGDEFDLAVGFDVHMPERVADEAIDLAWSSFDSREITRLVRMLARKFRVSDDEAWEGLQDGALELLERQPDLFREDPQTILGLLYTYASYGVLKVRATRIGGRLASLDYLLEGDPDTDQAPYRGSVSPAVAHTKANVDEDARFEPPPKGRREKWTRLQSIGAAQRFRDRTGRAPRTTELTRANGLPSLETIKSLGFKSLNDLLLEAGVPVEVPERERTNWEPLSTALRCLRWRRRRGYWPGGADSKHHVGDLPPCSAMDRFLGGTRPAFVQLGCEALLGPIDLPAEAA